MLDEAQSRPPAVGRTGQTEQERIGVQPHHLGAGKPIQHPYRGRAGSTAEIDDQRIRPVDHCVDHVGNDDEPLFSVGHVELLLAIPAVQPGTSGGASRHGISSITVIECFDSYESMRRGVTGQVDFGSHTDAVVAVAAALVNAATPGHRRGREYQPPVGAASPQHWAMPCGTAATAVGDPGGRTADALGPARARGAAGIHRRRRRGIDRAVSTVNDLLGRYRPVPYLDRHDGEPWHLHFHGPPGPDPSEWGGGVAVGLATVLGSEYADRLGVCQAPACDRVFVDVSRNGTRAFCSTACQNRVKAASHRAPGAGGGGRP